jgi:H+/Cl- antiporter ClcA
LDAIDETDLPLLEAMPVLRWWVRVGLLGVAAGLVAVFTLAVWLRPYDEDGQPLRMETHRQLGLPSCQFYFLTGIPCPSCGMTTSFALLMHRDLANSLRANAVGTLLGGFCLLLIPWCLASAYWRRPLFIRSLERALTWSAVVFLSLMLVRWAFVVAIALKDKVSS